jgi:excinuclease ABC subunit B
MKPNVERKKQIEYNFKNKVTPVQAGKKALLKPNISDTEITIGGELVKVYQDPILVSMAAEPDIKYNSAEEIKKKITKVKTAMTKAAKDMDFILAAKLRDEMYELEKQLITWG